MPDENPTYRYVELQDCNGLVMYPKTLLNLVYDSPTSETPSTIVTNVDLVRKATPNTGYLASYQLTVNGTALSQEIDIPKDFLLKSASLETVTDADKEEGGKFYENDDFQVGDMYLDFVINTKDASVTDEHIYINVTTLIPEIYSAGNGLELTDNVFSIKLATNSGLKVDGNGLSVELDNSANPNSGSGSGLQLGTSGLSVQIDETANASSGTGSGLNVGASGISVKIDESSATNGSGLAVSDEGLRVGDNVVFFNDITPADTNTDTEGGGE